MAWVPAIRALVVHAAVPVAEAAFQVMGTTPAAPQALPLVMALPLSVKVTLPDRATVAPAGALTVAVKVTESSTVEVPPVDEATDVDVAAGSMVSDVDPEPPVKFGSVSRVAEIVSLPASRLVVVQVAVAVPAAALTVVDGTVPSWGTSVDSVQTTLAVMALEKVTFPVGGVLAAPVSAAVRTSD